MKLLCIFALAVSLFSCAHHRDVRPSASGTHRVTLTVDEKEDGVRQSIAQANHFCETQGKYAAIVTEECKYVGDMDEESYKIAKSASNIARVFAGHEQSVHNTANAVDIARGKGYEVTLTFKCQ